jgi:hypothetical protein
MCFFLVSVSSHRLRCQFMGCIVTPCNFWSVGVLEEAAKLYQDKKVEESTEQPPENQ